MKYKLLVLDVDGTLLNDAKEISKRTLAALLKIQQMGIIQNKKVFLPIMVVRLSMHRTERFCLNVA